MQCGYKPQSFGGGAELAPISSASPPPIRSGKGGGKVMRKIASAGRANVCFLCVQINVTMLDNAGSWLTCGKLCCFQLQPRMCKFFMAGTCQKGGMPMIAHALGIA